MSIRFALAPMTWWLALMTWILLVIPVLALAAAFAAPSLFALGLGLFFVLVYATVWFWWRPSYFEIHGRALVLRWPLRRRVVPLDGLREVEIVGGDEFRRRYGTGLRVGAGGLWGAFGLLKTESETFSMYISRTDRFVLLRPREGRALLITPVEPERFADALRRAS